MDNVFIERLWWSLKYEDVYLRSYETPRDVVRGADEFKDPFSTAAGYGQLAGTVV